MPRAAPPRPALAVAAAGAVQAAAVSLAAVLVPAVAGWLAADDPQTSWQQAVRYATAGWLLAHHASLAVDGGSLGLPPLGLTAIAFGTCALSAAWMSRSLDPRAERIAAGLTQANPSPPPRRALAGFTGVYVLVALVAAVLSGGPELRPDPLTTAAGAAVLALGGAVAGAGIYRYGGVLAAGYGLARHAGLPGWVLRWLRAGVAALGFQLAASAVLLAVALAVEHDRITAVQRALDPGVVGGGVLTAIQLALLPNAVLWMSAFSAGPGFALGAGTSISPAGSMLGPLPAVPMLGALPPPGDLPSQTVAVLALPVLAGMLAGVILLQRARPLLLQLCDVLGAALVSGLAFLVLAWASGGAGGPGRLAEIGPVPWTAALALGLEIGAGAAAVVLLSAWAEVVRGFTSTRRAGHASS